MDKGLNFERLLGGDYLHVGQKRFIRSYLKFKVKKVLDREWLHFTYKTAAKQKPIDFDNLAKFKLEMYKMIMLTMIVHNGKTLEDKDVDVISQLLKPEDHNSSLRDPWSGVKLGNDHVAVPHEKYIPAQNLYQAIMILKEQDLL